MTAFPASHDPLGIDRSAFEAMAKTAASVFLRDNDGAVASRIIEDFSTATASKYNESHADIGRSLLLSALLLTMIGKYEDATEASNTARLVLADELGAQDDDFRAADFLAAELQRKIGGEREAGDPPIIAKGNPIGDFLFGLQ